MLNKFIKLILLITLSLAALGGCAVVNSLRMMNANNNITPTWSGKSASSSVQRQQMPAFYIGEKPYVKVNANGKELLFLIDTGASFTMLFDTPATTSLSFEQGFSLDISGWGDGDNTPAYQTQLKQVSIGDIQFNDVKVAYIPVSTSQYYLLEEEAIFDGVLGHDLLRHFVWTFDKRHQQITVSASGYEAQAHDVVIPFEVELSKLSIPIEVAFNNMQTVKERVLIDTGSRHYFKLSSAYLSNNNIQIDGASIEAADFGLSGMAKHNRYTLPQLTLGTLTLPKVKANVITSSDEDDWWIIGSALMNQFVTIVDYPNQQFVVREYANSQYQTKYNLAGLDLRKLRSGQLLVRYVYPNLAAAKAGMSQGDIVVSINKVPSTNITEQVWLDMVAKPSTFNMCLQNGMCIDLTTHHIERYSN
ncbi:MAG: aspartyl protease family protein [Glaciecola sp.]